MPALVRSSQAPRGLHNTHHVTPALHIFAHDRGGAQGGRANERRRRGRVGERMSEAPEAGGDLPGPPRGATGGKGANGQASKSVDPARARGAPASTQIRAMRAASARRRYSIHFSRHRRRVANHRSTKISTVASNWTGTVTATRRGNNVPTRPDMTLPSNSMKERVASVRRHRRP